MRDRTWALANRGRIRRTNKAFRLRNKRYQYQWNKLHPERKKAWDAVYYAIRIGKLIRPGKCPECGKKCFSHAHHYLGYKYKHRLDVKWLCITCHGRTTEKEHKLKHKQEKELIEVFPVVTCKKCGYRWQSRVPKVRSCPECKARMGQQQREGGVK